MSSVGEDNPSDGTEVDEDWTQLLNEQQQPAKCARSTIHLSISSNGGESSSSTEIDDLAPIEWQPPPAAKRPRRNVSNGTKNSNRNPSVGDKELMESVVLKYPDDDPECASLYGEHLIRLNPNQTLNDELVRFGIKYTLNKYVPDSMRSSILLFDSTFSHLNRFHKLSAKSRDKFLVKYPLSERIKYLVIPCHVPPVGAHIGHWYLILVTEMEELFKPDLDKRIIWATMVFMNSEDSTTASEYRSMTTPIRDYLSAYYEQLHKRKVEIRFRNRKPKLPCQRTNFDCGIFMIEYLRYYFEHEKLLRPWILSISSKPRPKEVPKFAANEVSKLRRREWANIILNLVDSGIEFDLMQALGWDDKLLCLSN